MTEAATPDDVSDWRAERCGHNFVIENCPYPDCRAREAVLSERARTPDARLAAFERAVTTAERRLREIRDSLDAKEGCTGTEALVWLCAEKALAEIHDALAGHPPSVQPDGWRSDMEAAPKDGTFIDVWADGRRFTNVRWAQFDPDSAVPFGPKHWLGTSYPANVPKGQATKRIYRNVTHWRPIPSAPEQTP